MFRRWLTRIVHQRRAGTPTLCPDSIGEGTEFLPGFKLEIRLGENDRRILIGENSLIACRIVLERSIGSIHIGNNTYVGNSQIICADRIDIGSDVLIAWGCTIVDHDSHSIYWRERSDDVRLWHEGIASGGLDVAASLKKWDVVSTAPVCICDKAWLGFNVIVLKGTTIGEGAVVGAGSVVTKDVPPWTLVAGNRHAVIRELPQDKS